jgi:hypothetical protein
MERAILEPRIHFTALLKLILQEWEEDVPVLNGWPGRRVDLNSLGDKGLLVDVVVE